MFRNRKTKGCAAGGVGCKAQRRARVEAAGAAELSAVEAADALKPAVLEQQLEQAPTTSPMASSEAVPVCRCTESRAHLSAADAVSCHPCDQCGVLSPSTSIAQAAACVRVELGLPPVAGSGGEVRSTRSRSDLNAPCRPHGGPALLEQVPSAHCSRHFRKSMGHTIYFTNFYPALLHCDKDRYIETWALVRCPGPFSDPRRAPGGHAADAGGTHLPLRGLVLHLLPNIDVAHAFFRSELHVGHDGGPDAASLLRGSADGWPCAFQLQSGGCKEASLVGRFCF